MADRIIRLAEGRGRQRPMSSSAATPDRMPPMHSARLAAAAAANEAVIAAMAPARIGSPVTRYHISLDEGQPTSAITTIVKSTATIMNATPPYEPATWLGS